MARPSSEQKVQFVTASIHVSNTMMTIDSLPYAIISAVPGIEVVQQHHSVTSSDLSEGGIQGVPKAIIRKIRRV